MLIKIINVSQPEKVKTYFTMEVNYKDDQGRTQGKKLMSFTAPEVFNTLKTAAQGDTYEITTEKDKNGYWQWTSAVKADGATTGGAKPQPASQVQSRGSYETAEERAARQRLIVRQSSLSAAVATLTVGSKSLNPEDVLVLAEKYNDWVFEVKSPLGVSTVDISEIDNDIPY